jgi:hypothetical protein
MKLKYRCRNCEKTILLEFSSEVKVKDALETLRKKNADYATHLCYDFTTGLLDLIGGIEDAHNIHKT